MYSSKVLKVIDGDTLKVQIDLGFEIFCVTNIRLGRIDAPEIKGPERPQGLISKAELTEFIDDQEILIQSTEKGKYGRYIAEVWIQKGETWININNWLLENELAVPYD